MLKGGYPEGRLSQFGDVPVRCHLHRCVGCGLRGYLRWRREVIPVCRFSSCCCFAGAMDLDLGGHPSWRREAIPMQFVCYTGAAATDVVGVLASAACAQFHVWGFIPCLGIDLWLRVVGATEWGRSSAQFVHLVLCLLFARWIQHFLILSMRTV